MNPSPSFIIFALPRSRTAWLSNFLSYGDWHCGHDEVRHMRSMDDVRAWLSQPNTGTIETSVAPWWRLLAKLSPDAKVVLIRRPVEDVVGSLLSIPGCQFDRGHMLAEMQHADRKLDQIAARWPGATSIDYADLAREEVCAALFERCLPYAHDSAHWGNLEKLNIQVNMPALIRYCDAYAPALRKLAAVATQQSHSMLSLRRPVHADGMSFQTESFDGWLADAQHLLAEHHTQIGEEPQNWRTKNIPLLRAIDEMGLMRITTARSNGRMFGYLMTLLTPSLAKQGVLTAVNTAFFADPSCPGLGMKLQREALASFKENGVGEVLWETNTVGGGARISSIYRRLGAEEKGSVYRLNLAEAA